MAIRIYPLNVMASSISSGAEYPRLSRSSRRNTAVSRRSCRSLRRRTRAGGNAGRV